MATVGEMVCAAAARMPKPNITLRQIQEAASFFRTLGIWDAEVQWAQWHGEGYTDFDLLQVWGDEHPRSRASEEPGAFRVIVLPAKEE